MKSFIPYGRQDISHDDIEKVVEVLKSDFITQGPAITEFESKLCEETGAKYAIVFNSATAALHAAYQACGLTTGDELITTPNTFVATSNAALYLNATPVFADIESTTGNIDINSIRKKISPKTKVIAPVDYSGQPCDMSEIYQLAKANNCYVVEDASHAIGSSYKDVKTGNGAFADITIFSFHPVKILTTGEGGAALTNNAEFAKKMQQFRSHGIVREDFKAPSHGPWYYEMQDLGFNFRITDIQAALGLSQISRLNSFITTRNEIALRYQKAFEGNPYFDILEIKPERVSSYHLYPILLKDNLKSKKKIIFEKLRENNIGVQCHYIPVNSQPYYQTFGHNASDTPKANDFYEREISIPMYSSLSLEEQQYVIDTLIRVCSELT